MDPFIARIPRDHPRDPPGNLESRGICWRHACCCDGATGGITAAHCSAGQTNQKLLQAALIIRALSIRMQEPAILAGAPAALSCCLRPRERMRPSRDFPPTKLSRNAPPSLAYGVCAQERTFTSTKRPHDPMGHACLARRRWALGVPLPPTESPRSLAIQLDARAICPIANVACVASTSAGVPNTCALAQRIWGNMLATFLLLRQICWRRACCCDGLFQA